MTPIKEILTTFISSTKIIRGLINIPDEEIKKIYRNEGFNQYESYYLGFDSSHFYYINNYKYSIENSPVDVFEKEYDKKYMFPLTTINHICEKNFIKYIELSPYSDSVDGCNESLETFKYFYKILLQTKDDELKTKFYFYWSDLIKNIAHEVVNSNTKLNELLLHANLKTDNILPLYISLKETKEYLKKMFYNVQFKKN